MPQMGKNRILIVDDEPNTIVSLQTILKKEGFVTRVASSGEKAIEEIKKIRPDLILLDLVMPGLNGIETLKCIRGFNQEVIVIVITAYPSFESASEAMRNGAYDYITKPYNIDDVLFTVKRGIEKKELQKSIERMKNRELHERNDELTRFTYTVSHDLKSPLVTVKTFLGYLEQDIRKQDAQNVDKDINYISRAADKMGRLLDELLDFARVGNKMNPPVDVLLQKIVQEALSLVAGRITGRGVEVVVTQEPVILFGDQPRLLEVFVNLLDNAVKFMGEQPRPRVEIGVETQGSETVLFVRDNGIGIDPRHQNKLFGLFEKLDPAAEGTGMGLVLARRIVELHNGIIWMKSEGPDKGTTFFFTLANTKRQSSKEDSS